MELSVHIIDLILHGKYVEIGLNDWNTIKKPTLLQAWVTNK